MARQFPHFDVLGVPLSIVKPDVAAAALLYWSNDGSGRFVTMPDAASILRAQDDGVLMDVHRSAALVCADCALPVWLAERAQLPMARTGGLALLTRLLAARPGGIRHYFFGARSGMAEAAKTRAEQDVPGIVIAGLSDSLADDLDDVEIVQLAEDIRACRADFVWIGLATPRQEYLMRRLVNLTPATLIGIGTALGTYGTASLPVQRPQWLQDIRRQWRRCLITAPRFAFLVARRRLVR